MKILAIDPGPEQSAWLWLIDGKPGKFAKESNGALLLRLEDSVRETIVIEDIQSMGMIVGASVFSTCKWIGRFHQAAKFCDVHFLFRNQIKMKICGSSRAKDANIRASLIDRFGGSKEIAIGKKAKPGPLFGIAADVWSSLAIAVTFHELNHIQKPF